MRAGHRAEAGRPLFNEVMRVSEVVVERRVAAPVEAVWRVLTDPERGLRVLGGVERVEPPGPEPLSVGSRWRETRRTGSRLAFEDRRVSVYEPGVRLVVESEVRGTLHVWEFTLLVYLSDGREQSPATTVRVTCAGYGPERGLGRVLARLLGTVDDPGTERRATACLADLAAAVEGRCRDEESGTERLAGRRVPDAQP